MEGSTLNKPQITFSLHLSCGVSSAVSVSRSYFSFLVGADNVAVSGVYPFGLGKTTGIDIKGGMELVACLSCAGFIVVNLSRKCSVCEA